MSGTIMPIRARGRKPRVMNPLVPMWDDARPKGRMMAVQIPDEIDWLQGMPALLGGLHNAFDQDDPNGVIVGNCTIAAVLHMLQVLLFRTTGRFWTRAELSPLALSLYSKWCGYVLGRPETDNGGVIQHILTLWMTEGVPLPDGTVHKILGFVEIDVRNEADIREAIAVCGVVNFGGDIPEAYDQIGPGDSWLPNEGPGNSGHSFFSAKYLKTGLIMDTWGFQVPMPDPAPNQYLDEAYAIFSGDWIQKTGRSPFNMTISEIEMLMAPLKLAA